jgi:hypothetical protein
MLEKALLIYSKKLFQYRLEPTEFNYNAVEECIAHFEFFECYHVAEMAKEELKKLKNRINANNK